MVDFGNVKSDAGLAKLDAHMRTASYVGGGHQPTQQDVVVFGQMHGRPCRGKYPHAARWYQHIMSFSAVEKAAMPGQKPHCACAAAAAKKTDDDFDLFGEETAEEKAVKKNMKAAAAAPAKKKKEVIEKSQLILDVKPASPTVNLDELEKKIREIKMEGTEWSVTCKRLPIAFGLMKIQIGCNIVDALVATDDLLAAVESIGMTPEQKEAFLKRRETGEDAEDDEDEDAEPIGLVQSAEIVSFNKL